MNAKCTSPKAKYFNNKNKQTPMTHSTGDRKPYTCAHTPLQCHSELCGAAVDRTNMGTTRADRSSHLPATGVSQSRPDASGFLQCNAAIHGLPWVRRILFYRQIHLPTFTEERHWDTVGETAHDTLDVCTTSVKLELLKSCQFKIR